MKKLSIFILVFLFLLYNTSFASSKSQEINNKNNIYYNNKVVVLTYHHISPKPFSFITIKPQRFEEDIKTLINSGFNFISIKQLTDAMQGKYTLPPNAVAITFDDGLESFYVYAYPILKKYNVPALNSIITSRTENYKSFNSNVRPLNMKQIKEMYESGLVDIASHSHNSHELVYINSKLKQGGKLAFRIYDKNTKKLETEDEYIKRVSSDLNKSREIIYKYTGKYPDILCFPFGHYGSRVLKVAKSCGFKYFITSQYGFNKYSSKSVIINRIRAGDYNLSSQKLKENIIKCANPKNKSSKKNT
ncbi:polysaccharide deacetylase [Caloramator sp. E03]|uniref:polysaccharide deacetylase family protein n=1 Tax=Caloramator sp. E03 TaxID=2576307 RepID=UPI001110022A|nr:polysaccharide deacetylase family protein [Caloramator sp. E03]QCX34203.1 polysaccharide deacetylase [Caloramator sp. E03]